MIYLLPGIAFTTLMVFTFKWYQVFNVHTFFAIVVNYLVAIIAGALSFGTFPDPAYIITQPFFPFALVLGFCFVAVFSLMAYVTQKAGPTLTSVSARMSLVIPVLFGIIYFHETSEWWKIAGFCMTIPAVIFASRQNGAAKTSMKYLPLALVLFLGNGFVDTTLSFTQQVKVKPGDIHLFIISIFICAFIMGMLWFLVSGKFKGARKGIGKNFLGGIVLGTVNFVSLYFVLSAIDSGEIDSSVFFAFFNIGVIITTAIGAVILFKEKLNRWNIIGIALAVVAIVLVGWETLQYAFFI